MARRAACRHRMDAVGTEHPGPEASQSLPLVARGAGARRAAGQRLHARIAIIRSPAPSSKIRPREARKDCRTKKKEAPQRRESVRL